MLKASVFEAPSKFWQTCTIAVQLLVIVKGVCHAKTTPGYLDYKDSDVVSSGWPEPT